MYKKIPHCVMCWYRLRDAKLYKHIQRNFKTMQIFHAHASFSFCKVSLTHLSILFLVGGEVTGNP